MGHTFYTMTYYVNADCFHSHATISRAYFGLSTATVHCKATSWSPDLLCWEAFFAAELGERNCIRVRIFDDLGFAHILHSWQIDRIWGQCNPSTQIPVPLSFLSLSYVASVLLTYGTIALQSTSILFALCYGFIKWHLSISFKWYHRNVSFHEKMPFHETMHLVSQASTLSTRSCLIK